ncbi:hypothetical protein [Pontimonas sp.]|uniref:hypothetical protein n=1 Tax=Pontimonas sp. TaxID=2304492 RepID=UPI0028706AC7|nr:hypothetical protein [Pontimonas sp.]MDR9397019.1 hypothetical protein [Pontimonas sp.]
MSRRTRANDSLRLALVRTSPAVSLALSALVLTACVGGQGEFGDPGSAVGQESAETLDSSTEALDSSTEALDSSTGLLGQGSATSGTRERAPENTPDPLAGRSTDGSESLEGAQSDGPMARSQDIATPSVSDVTPQAVETIRRYLALTDRVGASGGAAADDMAQIVTPEWLPVEQRGFADYRERGIKTLGQTDFFAPKVQSVRSSHNSLWEVAVFACIDSRNVWVVPANSPDPPEGLVEWLSTAPPPGERAPDSTLTPRSTLIPGDDEDATDGPTDAEVAIWQEFIAQTQPDAGPLEPVLLWLVGTGFDSLKVDATDAWRGYHPCGSDSGGQ